MTEAEWQSFGNPRGMLAPLVDHITRRKSLLAAAACCRLFWPHPPGSELEACIKLVDRFVDGSASEDEIDREMGRVVANGDTFVADWEAAMIGILDLACPPLMPLESALRFAKRELGAYEATLLRCIVGNPFRPASLDPSWLTSTVVALAEGIYADRTFDRLPILADALEDAGCGHADILAHCRDGGPHARGCWVVDLVLGKE